MPPRNRQRKAPQAKMTRAPLRIGAAAASIAILSGIYAATGRSGSESPAVALPTNIVSARISQDYADCAYRFEDVRSGLVAMQSYLDDALSCMPELAQAKSEGAVAGIVTTRDLDSIETKMLDMIGKSDVDRYTRAMAGAFDYKRGRIYDIAEASVFPNPGFTMGYSIPAYIVVSDKFAQGTIENDADARGVLKHESVHVMDQYSGITLGGVRIDADTLASNTVSADFFSHLFEFRAHSIELESIMAATLMSGSNSNSQGYLRSVAANFVTHSEAMKALAITPTERSSAQAQFSLSSAITYSISTDGYVKFMYSKDGKTLPFGLVPKK